MREISFLKSCQIRQTWNLEAEDSGVLLKITRQAGETVPVTEVIGYIGAEGEVVAGNAASALQYRKQLLNWNQLVQKF